MQSPCAPDFVFLDETCITLTEDTRTGNISQAWSNEVGWSRQCNCVCYKNFIFESYALCILGGLCGLLIITLLNMLFKKFSKNEFN